jgi:DnaJ-class molecular chaperone
MTIVKYTIVIIERTPESFLVKCGYCKGSGHSYGTCSVCNGVGTVRLKVPPDWHCDAGILKCAYCNGSGHAQGTCSVCRGVGCLVKCFPRVVCSTCSGSGHHVGVCGVCEGTGSVWVENIKSY